MQEEKRPLDPTRRILRVFGVKVTDYEERTAAILQQAAAVPPPDAVELARLAKEVVDLTAELNVRLRDITAYVLDMQSKTLNELRNALDRKDR